MRLKTIYLLSIIYILFILPVNGQVDTLLPEIPELKLVSINQFTGNVEISWSLSPSPDVAGYIFYYHHYDPGFPGGGYSADPIDTLWDPAATNYSLFRPFTSYFSESYVIAAIDSSKNKSPYSKVALPTIFAKAQIDTCKKKMEVRWNRYPSRPDPVVYYSVLISVEGGLFSEFARVPADTSLIINDFTTEGQYCFIVRAILESGHFSGSNTDCLNIRMQRPPDWINADYATVAAGNEILLSFTIDPASEIRTFSLEKKTGPDGIFREIEQFTPVSGSVLYSDRNADTSKINYYRLSAVNNCINHITTSNIASNMVLALERDEFKIILKWNPYRKWNGITSSEKLFVKTGMAFKEMYPVPPGDTVFSIMYSDLMYDISSPEVCFMIRSFEASNPYGTNGESRSSTICTPVTENIIVPNTFTPDNNLINDSFKPVLSFTPVYYRLIIYDLQRRTLFETSDSTDEWDGTKNGSPLPEGVYLWFLKVTTPSGRNISRSGTVSIIINR
ncbi:MAG: gliding motility-associated C-terminal domain-containing protein [Bacteroidales bacterium]|jgi:gliding motility-associated-like protein|nr:gliding motility-associated C-terminal domain-containing protein [Bacteroidales bacterium]